MRIFQYSKYSQTCIKQHCIKGLVVKVPNFVPHQAVIVTLDWVLAVCLYCLPSVFNGHLQQMHSNRTKNNLSHKVNPYLSSEFNILVVLLSDFLYINWSTMAKNDIFIISLHYSILQKLYERGSVRVGNEHQNTSISIICHLGFETSCKYMAWDTSKGLEYPCLVIDQVPLCYILNKQTSNFKL